MKRLAIVPTAAVVAGGGALGAAGLLAGRPSKPIWTETAWAFPIDPWGKGKAFRCRAEHCGAEVDLYVRAKIGSCGCVTAIDKLVQRLCANALHNSRRRSNHVLCLAEQAPAAGPAKRHGREQAVNGSSWCELHQRMAFPNLAKPAVRLRAPGRATVTSSSSRANGASQVC